MGVLETLRRRRMRGRRAPERIDRIAAVGGWGEGGVGLLVTSPACA